MSIPEDTPSKPVGLTGGIASGKTAVANMFADLGAIVLNADRIASRVLKPGHPALTALVRHFGIGIRTGTGSLNRTAMLDILLSEPDAMQAQIEILRPYILPRIDAAALGASAKHPDRIVIVEAPLLFEYGHPERYHPIIVVTVSRQIQAARLMRRSGKDMAWATGVIDLQWPLEKKEKHADFIVCNDSTLENTQKQVKRIYRILREVPTR